MDASSPEMLRLAAMIRNTVVRVTGAIDEDLVQDVWVALLPLIPTWDSTRNDSLAGFLVVALSRAVIDALRKRNAIEALCTWHRGTGRAACRPVVHVQVGMFDGTTCATTAAAGASPGNGRSTGRSPSLTAPRSTTATNWSVRRVR